MTTITNLTALKELEGQTLPPSGWLEITQEMVNSFASATLDFQWIHVDVERARQESPFKGPVAHGFMSVSLLPKFILDEVKIESAKLVINYGLNKVRFPHPVPVGSLVRLHTTVAKVEEREPAGVQTFWDCVIEIKGVEKPACVGQFITLMYE